MKTHGRGKLADGYLSMLRRLSPYRSLGDGKSIKEYLSCMFSKNGEPDVTSYLTPEGFHPVDGKDFWRSLSLASPGR